MKKEIKIQVTQCDFCDVTSERSEIRKCYVCGKDFCPDCGYNFSDKKSYKELDICALCLEKFQENIDKINEQETK